MTKQISGNFPPYFQQYINLVPQDDLLPAFEAQQQQIDEFLASIPEEKTDTPYAPGKWTLKEMLQHIIDAERIFCYRALCIARNEKNSLPGFDENEYARYSNANGRSWDDLINELRIVRKGTSILYKSFDEDMLKRQGLANNFDVSPVAIGFTILGHLYHHLNIIESRYLLETPL